MRAVVNFSESEAPTTFNDCCASVDDDGELIVFQTDSAEIVESTYDWWSVRIYREGTEGYVTVQDDDDDVADMT